MRDALDAAWGDFPTNDIGYDWLRYTGNARPTREWCAAVSLHSRVTFVMETTSRRSSEPSPAGRYDCLFAERRAREVHPGVESIAVVVSDGDAEDNWNASQYGADWASVATLPFFPYGAVPICQSFLVGAYSVLALNGEWVPETWGIGRLMSQVVGYSPLPNTDLNRVWAPYYPTSGPSPTPPPQPSEDSDVISVNWFGTDHHVWSDTKGKVLYRAYSAGQPGPVLTVPGNDGHGGAWDYEVIDDRPLNVLGNLYYGGDGYEVVVKPTPFGAIATSS